MQEGFFLGDLHSHGGETDITGKREESHAYQTLEEGRRTTAVVLLLFNVHVISMRFYFIEVFLLGAVLLSMMHLSEGKRILFLNLSCAGRLPSLASSFPTSESFLLFLGLLAIMKCLFICFWKYLPLVVKVPLPRGPVTIPYDAFNCCCIYHPHLYKYVVMKFCSHSFRSESCSDMPFIMFMPLFMFKV